MSNDFNSAERKSLLNFSNCPDRATLVDLSDSESDSMPSRLRRSKRRKTSRRPARRGLKGVRVTKGKVSFRLAGYSGVQKVGASELVRHIPLTKLKTAAKRILGRPIKRLKKFRGGRKRRGGKRRTRRRRRR